MRDRACEGALVIPRTADDDHLALLHRRKRGKDPGPVAFVAELERFVHEPEVVEVVAAVLLVVGE